MLKMPKNENLVKYRYRIVWYPGNKNYLKSLVASVSSLDKIVAGSTKDIWYLMVGGFLLGTHHEPAMQWNEPLNFALIYQQRLFKNNILSIYT